MNEEERGLPVEVDDVWPAAEPPAGFADRVMAARKPARRAGLGARAGLLAGAAAAVAAALVALIVLLRPTPVASGTIVAAERVEASLGVRAVAVAEPGAALSYRVAGDGARVEQTRGEVFYRVERGGPFVVHTAAADVIVQGTCFTVEVIEMRIGKQALGGAAVGALITSAVFVTVYEGKVLLANERGKTQIRAGERAAAGGGDAPGPAVVVKRAGKPSEPVAVAPPPPDGASREQLLARDDQQRKEIAALRAKLQTLEGATMEGGGPGKRPGETKSFMSPTHDELVEMAKTCTIQYDTPPLSVDVPPLPAKALAKMGLTDAEGEQVHKAFVEVGARALAQLRAIYVEVTGNTAAADDLTGNAMMREIEEKAGQDEVAEAARQLSQERAGLAPPPANLVARPPAERMLRIASHVGDELETEIGKALGPERAHELRAMGDGWPARSKMAGCRDQDNGDGEETEKQH